MKDSTTLPFPSSRRVGKMDVEGHMVQDLYDAGIRRMDDTTLTALQALALLNNPFMLQQAELLATRVRTYDMLVVADAIARLKTAIEYGRTFDCAEVLKSKEHCAAN